MPSFCLSPSTLSLHRAAGRRRFPGRIVDHGPPRCPPGAWAAPSPSAFGQDPPLSRIHRPHLHLLLDLGHVGGGGGAVDLQDLVLEQLAHLAEHPGVFRWVERL